MDCPPPRATGAPAQSTALPLSRGDAFIRMKRMQGVNFPFQ